MCCCVRISSSLFDWSENINSFEPCKRKLKIQKKKKKLTPSDLILERWSQIGISPVIPMRSQWEIYLFCLPIKPAVILCNLLEQFANDFGGQWPVSPLTLLQRLRASVAFQKPQRVLINHIWSRSLLGFITANSLVIRKTVLHVKSKNMTDGYL